jgi:ADP-ribosylglycohydrolase
MISYFIDIDNFLFKENTLIPKKGAVNFINGLLDKKNQIIFITKTSYNGSKTNFYKTKRKLKELGFANEEIIEGIKGNKMIINDEGAFSINYKTKSIENEVAQEDLEKKVYNALAANVWANWIYMLKLKVQASDDYVQTIIIAKSLIENNGFNHRDLVKKYRQEPFKNMYLARKFGCLLPDKYYGQIRKLLNSSNPLYTAKDGITDGSAMKISPVPAFYFYESFEKLISITDQIVRVTHGSVDARLAAILITLRYRQIFSGKEIDNIDSLLKDFDKAVKLLGLEKEGCYFLNKVKVAADLTKKEKDPFKLLIKLVREMGMTHFAWSTPITACFWSYRADNNFKRFNSIFKKTPTSYVLDDGGKVSTLETKPSVLKEFERRLTKFDPELKRRHKGLDKGFDIDTFTSIGFSLIAASQGIEPIKDEVKEAIKTHGDDLKNISYNLVYLKNKRSTYFIDLDGVFFRSATMTPTKGAVDFVNKLVERGDQVIFVTKRFYKNNNDPKLNLYKTKRIFKKLGVKYNKIVEGVLSPRIMISNEKTIAINHETNKPLTEDALSKTTAVSKYSFKKDSKLNFMKMKFIVSLWRFKRDYYPTMDRFIGQIGLGLKKRTPFLYNLLKKVKPFKK